MTTIEVNQKIEKFENEINEIKTTLGLGEGKDLLVPLYKERAQLREQQTVLLGHTGNGFVTRALGT